MMKNARQMKGLAMALVLVAAGTLPTRADWVQTTGGTYDYGAAANWTGGISNNVFLSSPASSFKCNTSAVS